MSKKKKSNKSTDDTIVYKTKKKKNTKLRKRIKIVVLILFLILIICAGIAFGLLYGVIKDAKLEISDLSIKYDNSVVKDIEGNTIAVLSGDENREIISITDMAEYLPLAFVAIEDERFYDHMGVDIKRTAAATVTYVLNRGSSSFGGSTITQQLVKNLTNEKEKTWKRKVTEMARAYYIEQELSKDQILELYLNLIFMGGNAYGVQIASNYYFSKSASELDLAECAFLAGINNTPNSYNPFISDNANNLERIKNRTKIVLDKMKELGKIKSEEEYNVAVEKVNAGLPFNEGKIRQNVYTYHTDAALTQIINELREQNDWTYEYAKLYLFSRGFTIYTTQNTTIQNRIQEEFAKDTYRETSKKTKDADENYVKSQAAMVLLDHKTGYVLGVSGGLGTKNTSFGLNRATQSVRQTGSSMKPLAVVAPGINNRSINCGNSI